MTGETMTDVVATSQEVRDLFFSEPYTTNAIADAFRGASRSHVLLIKALMDVLTDRAKKPTWENAQALNATISALTQALAVGGVAEGHTDTARLDWLEERARASFGNDSRPAEIRPLLAVADYTLADSVAGETIILQHSWSDETVGPTLRAAIDAAMGGA